jgi:hypothetical protein
MRRRAELKRLREWVEGLLPSPTATILLSGRAHLGTGETEGFARRFDAFDGRLSKAPGFMETFKVYAFQQYEGYPFNGGNTYLFVPGDPPTRYEQARLGAVHRLHRKIAGALPPARSG